MAHAAESTHYYTRDGKPAYTVTAKAGHQRPTTLADARKLSLVPSVTTIIKSAAAPALEVWKQTQVLHAALTLPRMPDELEAVWIGRVWEDSRETARKAAEKGTAIHAAIQGSYEGRHPGEEYLPHTLAADAEIVRWLNKPSGLIVEAEQSFSHPLGFGGKVDLNGEHPHFVLDFKTKEFDENADLKTYDEHAMQLAAYREGLKLPTARCAIVYVSVTNPGLSRLIEIPEEELSRGWEMFTYLLGFWKSKNRFR